MDAVAQDGEIIAYAISEHIEFAGVHSGDATIQFPPQKLYVETVRRIKRISREIARELNISGPFNIQYLARENDIKVIECNLRASRSFPFVSKVLKINLIELATKVMLGIPVQKPDKNLFDLDYVASRRASSPSTVCRRPTRYWGWIWQVRARWVASAAILPAPFSRRCSPWDIVFQRKISCFLPVLRSRKWTCFLPRVCFRRRGIRYLPRVVPAISLRRTVWRIRASTGPANPNASRRHSTCCTARR